MHSFSPTQRKVFIGCFVVYGGAYIARLNFAAALPALMTTFSLTEAQGGLIQSLFALLYAGGQFVNGAIVDHISAKKYLTVGLLASCACNVAVGLANAYWQVLLFWALNGAAQSMLWTPVVKLLAGWFDENQRRHISLWTGVCAIAGHFIAWAVSGYMAQLLSWRFSFFIPAALLLLFVALAQWLLHDPHQPLVTAARADRTRQAMPLRTMVFGTGLWLVLICCAANGFARDGVMTWGPTILNSLQMGSAAVSATTLSLVIPLINLAGLFLGQYLLRRSAGRPRVIIALLMGAGTLVSLVLTFMPGGNIAWYALLLGLCCALMNGVNPLETVVLPMEYAVHGRVGLAAGMIDSFVYLGSALAAVLTGFLRDTLGMQAVYACWAAVTAIGAAAALLSIPRARAYAEGRRA